MKSSGVRATSATGLWIATVVLLLFVAQAMIGVSLLRRSEPPQIGVRHLYFAMAILLIALAGAHLVLNG